MKKQENDFKRKKVVPFLLRLPNCYFFIKEAVSLRGIPDIVGCVKGRFFALELKASEADARKKTGRIVLQKFTLDKIKENNGVGMLCYPENWEEVKDVLTLL